MRNSSSPASRRRRSARHLSPICVIDGALPDKFYEDVIDAWPEDATFRKFGTSFYEPLDGDFRCSGGPHPASGGFRRVETVEFLPNRLVMFPKSDRCFHGVEPIDLPGIDRRLLIYDVFRTDLSRPPA